ncbi:hypothetical protein [Halalkalicoccus subterraneus]|uniref:hypothetical protein n=1 Tax=Halalkalicoccus subterraneus TaxID=2675002 RepID=UPI000EFAC8DF|nr:hypothetical protein [Halalkalicoccus subterraneus]
MNVGENTSTGYTHSREFSHRGYDFRVRINDDLMSYTATASCDGDVVVTVLDLGAEAARWSHATVAETVLD